MVSNAVVCEKRIVDDVVGRQSAERRRRALQRKRTWRSRVGMVP